MDVGGQRNHVKVRVNTDLNHASPHCPVKQESDVLQSQTIARCLSHHIEGRSLILRLLHVLLQVLLQVLFTELLAGSATGARPTLTAGLARLLRRKLVSGALLMRRLAALARDLMLLF